jgi:hypothetical protein
MPISKIDTKINIDVNAELVNAIGNNLGRFGVYCVENIKNVISFFVKKVPNATEEKFTTMCQTSPTALRMIDDSKFAGTEEMQEIRARILAQEYNHPNSISMRSWEEMKKMSATEFKYFEENIAPYCSNNLCVLSTIDYNIAANMKFMNGKFDYQYSYIDPINLAHTNQENIVAFPFKNHHKLHLSINAMQKIQNKKISVLLTEFGFDLCKICEPRPWDLSVINETKIELEKLGLIYNTDFQFLDENNQNILQ